MCIMRMLNILIENGADIDEWTYEELIEVLIHDILFRLSDNSKRDMNLI